MKKKKMKGVELVNITERQIIFIEYSQSQEIGQRSH